MGSSGTPATASSTADGWPCGSTRSSRGSNRVASSPVATRMKSGWPTGATASSRTDAGVASPASRRPRTRRPPRDPATPTSALIVDTALQAAVASVSASAASEAGVPGPPGSFIKEGAHAAARMESAAAMILVPYPPPRVISFRASVLRSGSSCRCRHG